MAQRETTEQDKALSVFGFAKPSMRRNLIIGIIAVQFSAIVYLFKVVMNTNEQMFLNEQKHLEENTRIYEMVINRVDAKLRPVQQTADSVKMHLEENE